MKQINKLERQCAELNIPLDELVLPRVDDSWYFDGICYSKPEPAALAYYKSIGYAGFYGECAVPLNLIKCGCIHYFEELGHDPSDVRFRYFSALCIIYKPHATGIVDSIRRVTSETVKKHIHEIIGLIAPFASDPPNAEAIAWNIWSAIGNDGWANIAQSFFQPPCSSYSGWPDITLVTDNRARFVEVKTTDNLSEDQVSIIAGALVANGCDASALKIVPTADTRKPKPKPRKKTLMEMLAQRLKKLRIEHRITISQLADVASVTDEQYKKIEWRSFVPTISTVASLADFYKVSIDYLVGRTDDPGEDYQEKRRRNKTIVFKMNCVGLPPNEIINLRNTLRKLREQYTIEKDAIQHSESE